MHHNKLNFFLPELINFCFKGGSRNYIAVTKFGARWVDDKNCKLMFDKAKLKLFYFSIGNSTFRQVIGIPMCSHLAPFMADLFLLL